MKSSRDAAYSCWVFQTLSADYLVFTLQAATVLEVSIRKCGIKVVGQVNQKPLTL